MAEEILRSGSISFARFMELALYCPNFGYYERLDAPPGRRGDYYTSVSVGGLFGEMLAFQFAEWLGMLPAQPRQIVEAGAHDGSLARDILLRLQGHRPELFRSLEYWILEPSLRRRESQQETLGGFIRSVRWFDSWTDLPPAGVRGVIFSNELLDALPTHRLGWDAARKKWFPWGVTLAGEELVWTRMPEGGEFDIQAAARAVPGLPWNLPPDLIEVLPAGFSIEVCPAATEWWRGAARALKSGKIMTLDYGLTEEEFFAPERKQGTLRAYYRHHQSGNLFAHVGEQDITSQVNFTALMNAGLSEGLRTESWTTQAQFLTGILEGMYAKSASVREWTPAQTRQFQTLTHPEHLGRSFRVLVQKRAQPPDAEIGTNRGRAWMKSQSTSPPGDGREFPGAAQFGRTQWSVVLSAAGKKNPALAEQALEKLCRVYWLPLYTYIRRQGESPHDAQDLTQEFFACFLRKNFLGAVDQTKGRFRSYLLATP